MRILLKSKYSIRKRNHISLTVTIFFAGIVAFTSLFCNNSNSSSNPFINQGPTPFDNSTFIGTYRYSDDTEGYRLAGKIGNNGVITELQFEEDGYFKVVGGSSPAGELNLNASCLGLSNTIDKKFNGLLTLDISGLFFSGQGDWSGTIKTSTSTKYVGGSWEIYLDTTTKKFSSTGNYLCWTGTDDSSRQFKLLRMNGKTGEISVVGGQGYFTQLVYGPDNTLYGIGSTLSIIDPVTGEDKPIGKLEIPGLSGYILMSGAEFSPEGILYTVENGGGRIFTVDLSTGSLTLVGAPTIRTRDIAFSKVGTLYAGSSDLVILNLKDMTTHNMLGSDLYLGGSMTFTQSGVLIKNDCFPSKNLYSINPETGKAKAVLTLGSTGIGAIVEERIALKNGEPLHKTQRGTSSTTKLSLEYLKKLEQAHKNGISVIDF